MDPYAEAFVASRSAVTALARSLPEETWNATSPLTPNWRVRDVLAHLVGVSEDILSGRFPGDDMDAWTADHVARSLGDSVIDLAARWESTGIEAGFNEMFAQMLFDQISHEYDIRYALGVLGEHDTPGIRLTLTFAKRIMRGERACTLVLDGETYVARGRDEGAEGITLRATHFEYLRAATGRRSEAQVRAMDWTGDVSYVCEQLFGSGFFTPSNFDVHE